MKLVTQVQILHEVVCISLHMYDLGKGINLSVLSSLQLYVNRRADWAFLPLVREAIWRKETLKSNHFSTQYLVSNYFVSNIWYQIFGINIWYQIFRIKYFVSNISYQIIWYQYLVSNYLVSNIWYQYLGSNYLVSNIWNQHLVSNIWNQIFDINIWY